ncbi:ankyrin repeat-containing domain protein [Tirmania nivea]|nr:ankyrin repeat-containing domain protein [Tirmania nivea]
MALGTKDGGDNTGSSNQLNIAIDMNYTLAALAIIHFEPGVLVEGRTPFAYAYDLQRNELCEMLLQTSKVDRASAIEAVKLEGDFAGRMHAVIAGNCPQLLRLLLAFATSVDIENIGIEGLAHAAEVVLSSENINDKSWNELFETLLDMQSRGNIRNVEKIRLKPGPRRCIATSMHELVQEDYKSILQFLSLIKLRDTEGWTPLASAAFNIDEPLCEFLVRKNCSLCLDTEQMKQLIPKLSGRIHVAAAGGHRTALQLLLDMWADINEINSDGDAALLKAVTYNHLSCVKILIERGADATISTESGNNLLHRAVRSSRDGEMMKFLVGHIVETRARELVNARDRVGDTPLHDCCYGSSNANSENAKMLVEAGTTLTIENNYGRTPYELARNWESEEIAKYLWSHLSPEQQARQTPPPPDW